MGFAGKDPLWWGNIKGSVSNVLFKAPRRLSSGVTLTSRYVGPGLQTRATKSTFGVLSKAMGLNGITEREGVQHLALGHLNLLMLGRHPGVRHNPEGQEKIGRLCCHRSQEKERKVQHGTTEWFR